MGKSGEFDCWDALKQSKAKEIRADICERMIYKLQDGFNKNIAEKAQRIFQARMRKTINECPWHNNSGEQNEI